MKLRGRIVGALTAVTAAALLPATSVSMADAAPNHAVAGHPAVATRPSVAVRPTSARATAHRDTFVVRDGTSLKLAGRPFTMVGPNMYWTGLDENVGGIDPSTPGTVDYPSYFRIRDGLTTAKAMGSTVVRAHTNGISTGNPKSLEPALGQFNSTAFAAMDYTVAEARKDGLRLIVPLTDNYRYYHGGRYDFLNWLGLSTANDGALFYTDPQARAAYQAYIHRLLTHVNPLTGLAYRDDPTIMAWELGNELNGMTSEWIGANTRYLKRVAPRQLVAAGQQSGIDSDVLTTPQVDISDSHYYPPTKAGITADAATVTRAGKVYLAGEFATASASDTLLDQVAADPEVDGALFWSLFPHADHYGYVQHDDGYTVHYPGDTAAMRVQIEALTGFAATMTGTVTPAVHGDRPLLTAVTKTEGITTVAWRGTAGAQGYRIQRATAGSRWITVSGPDLVSDDAAPWLDQTTPTATASYRVVAVGASGAALATSAAVTANPRTDLTIDPLEDWYVASAHSKSLSRTATNHGVLVAPTGRTGTLTYSRPGLSRIQLDVVAKGRPQAVLQASANGTSGWQTIFPRVRSHGHQQWTLTATLKQVGAVRVRWLTNARPFSVSSVQLAQTATSTTTTAPGPFSLTNPAPGATGVSTLTGLTWTTSDRAAFYSLSVAPADDPDHPIVDVSGLRAPAYQPSRPLPADTELTVRVSATNGAGTTPITGTPIQVTTRPATPGALVDDFDSYTDDAQLAATYVPNSGGDPITPTLAAPGVGSGHSMELSYQLGANGYAGVIRTLAVPQKWSGTTGLSMWVQPADDGQQVNVQFVAAGAYWEHSVTLQGTQGRMVKIPFADFAPPPWAAQDATLDLSSISQFSLYPGGPVSTSSVRIDAISAYP